MDRTSRRASGTAAHHCINTTRALAVLIATLLPTLAPAAIVSTSVDGTADIYLAGQTTAEGPDTPAANSPVLVGGITLIVGDTLTFTASGITDGAGCTSTGADGCGGFTTDGGDTTISSYSGPAQALIGLFLGAAAPSSAPGGLAFGDTSFATLAPGLGVVFFIGDGLTGDGTGATQAFTVPADATRLYLATSDSLGAAYNNTGTFAVSVDDGLAAVTPPPTTPTAPTTGVPEPGTFGLLSLGAMGLVMKRRRAPADR